MDVKRQVLHAGLDSCEGEMTYQGITFMVDKCPHHMWLPRQNLAAFPHCLARRISCGDYVL